MANASASGLFYILGPITSDLRQARKLDKDSQKTLVVYLSIHPSIHPSVCLLFSRSIHLANYLSIYLSIDADTGNASLLLALHRAQRKLACIQVVLVTEDVLTDIQKASEQKEPPMRGELSSRSQEQVRLSLFGFQPFQFPVKRVKKKGPRIKTRFTASH